MAPEKSEPRLPPLLAAFFICLCASVAEAAPLRCALLLEADMPTALQQNLRAAFAEGLRKYELAGEIIMAPSGGEREALREAARAHGLVIVASDALHEALRDNAANFRRVMFGSIDAGIRAPNIMSVTFADEQAAFLAGACAAMLAKGPEPVIGWLSGADAPAMRSLFNGFAEGARLARPGCRVIQALAGSFVDPARALEKARALNAVGASVIAIATGDAAAIARELPVPVIVLDGDATSFASINRNAARGMDEIMASAASGKFRGKEIAIYNLADGGVDFIVSKSARVAPDILRRLRELRGELVNGSIPLRSLRQRTLCDCLD